MHVSANELTFSLSQAFDGTTSRPFLPILVSHTAFFRPAHMLKHQQALRIEHSWHCRAYIFHTQATMLKKKRKKKQNSSPSCPNSSSGTSGGSPPAPRLLLPSRSPHSAFELFFTSVAGLWQACCSDKIHDYAPENLAEKRCVVKTEVRRSRPSCFQLTLHPVSLTHGEADSQIIFFTAARMPVFLSLSFSELQCSNCRVVLPLRWQGIPTAVTGAD